MGEISSIPLNVRWFLLTTGRRNSAALRAANSSFALTFFCCRVLAYGAGLLHLLTLRVELATLGGERVPMPLLVVVLALLVAGYGLNLMWFRKIVRMAFKG
mmetsp:Transcript_41766/g.83801  ORF Transcript_41766/g.83801 Transcript_41766/m.83801 type:complete len:101 (-) Transcript_41766:512-814(-)